MACSASGFLFLFFSGKSMSELPPCPQCQSAFVYADGESLVCPECGHEWREGESAPALAEIRDAVGNLLQDGDSVTVIRDLKVKGASSSIKVGTKVRNIRLIREDVVDGHDIDCRIEGFGAMKLKSSVVKKA
jgi:protein PhnA